MVDSSVMDAQEDAQNKESGAIQSDMPSASVLASEEPPTTNSAPSGAAVKDPQAEISADAGKSENSLASDNGSSISTGGDSSNGTTATSSSDNSNVGSDAGNDGGGDVAAHVPSTSRSSSLNAAAPVFIPTFSVPAVAGQPAATSHSVGVQGAGNHLVYAGALLPLPHAAPGGVMPPGGTYVVHLSADGSGAMTWMPVADASAGLLPYPAAVAAANGGQVTGVVAGHHGRKGHGGKHGYVGVAAVQSGFAGDDGLSGHHGGDEHEVIGEAAGEGEEHSKEGEGGKGSRKRGKGKKADAVALSESELAAVKEKMKQQVEFYLGDQNLPSDQHLLKIMRRDQEGFVPLQVIAEFKKIKAMVPQGTRTPAVVALLAAALADSSVLVVCEDGMKVRRAESLGEVDVVEIQTRTVVADNLPENHSIAALEQLFGKAGRVRMVRVRSPDSTSGANYLPKATAKLYTSKVHAIVEYETAEEAEKAAELLNDESNWRSGLRVRLVRKREKPVPAHPHHHGKQPQQQQQQQHIKGHKAGSHGDNSHKPHQHQHHHQQQQGDGSHSLSHRALEAAGNGHTGPGGEGEGGGGGEHHGGVEGSGAVSGGQAVTGAAGSSGESAGSIISTGGHERDMSPSLLEAPLSPSPHEDHEGGEEEGKAKKGRRRGSHGRRKGNATAAGGGGVAEVGASGSGDLSVGGGGRGGGGGVGGIAGSLPIHPSGGQAHHHHLHHHHHSHSPSPGHHHHHSHVHGHGHSSRAHGSPSRTPPHLHAGASISNDGGGGSGSGPRPLALHFIHGSGHGGSSSPLSSSHALGPRMPDGTKGFAVGRGKRLEG